MIVRVLQVEPEIDTDPAELSFYSIPTAPFVSVYVATVNWRPVSAPVFEEQICIFVILVM